jgi:hypothetical protein
MVFTSKSLWWVVLWCSLCIGCRHTRPPEPRGLLEPDISTLVEIRHASSTPGRVKAGDKVTVVTDYAITVPRDIEKIEVEEIWLLKETGNIVTPPQRHNRVVNLGEGRTWWSLPLPKRSDLQTQNLSASAVLSVPSVAEPGTYVIEHKIRVGESYDIGASAFIVVE